MKRSPFVTVRYGIETYIAVAIELLLLQLQRTNWLILSAGFDLI